MPRKIKLLLAYDGTLYHGWQVQPNQVTIQDCLERGLHQILREKISVTGAGRTDSGVHAEGQVCHFTTTKEPELKALQKSLNALLPKEIRVTAILEAEQSFHARYSATAKIYRYRIATQRVILPFHRRFVYHHTIPCDTALIQQAIPYFIGKKSFKAFANESLYGSAGKDAVRDLFSLTFQEEADGFSLLFHGDGFLYKMVRNITGTLLDIASQKIALESLPTIFDGEDRKLAGKTAPPQGLTLMHVFYGPDIAPLAPPPYNLILSDSSIY